MEIGVFRTESPRDDRIHPGGRKPREVTGSSGMLKKTIQSMETHIMTNLISLIYRSPLSFGRIGGYHG